jgi:yeast amino acid transporter
MASQSDKIEPTSVVETKTAVYLGSQQPDSASDEGRDAEKHAISRRPELQRKLKSRHLQMIAIGMPLLVPLLVGY